MTNIGGVFLSAEWRDLVLLNYVVEPSLLQPFVPNGTKLGSFQGKTYISLVGFRFCKTKLWGKFAVPLHSEFEEVNLRFYVHRHTGDELRRGVVFIKEIVPKPAIALTARLIFGENYVSLPMKHKIAHEANDLEVEYSWKYQGNWSRLFARSSERPKPPAENSLEQYITEHYWGYTSQKSGALEYQVAHTQWAISVPSEALFAGNASELYGKEFGVMLSRRPDSAYVANGSPVEVYAGAEIQ
jgi:uncharacterized protein